MATITERFEARIPTPQKDVIRQASEITGRTMSDFVISAAVTLAEKVLEKERVWKLDSALLLLKLNIMQVLRAIVSTTGH